MTVRTLGATKVVGECVLFEGCWHKGESEIFWRVGNVRTWGPNLLRQRARSLISFVAEAASHRVWIYASAHVIASLSGLKRAPTALLTALHLLC